MQARAAILVLTTIPLAFAVATVATAVESKDAKIARALRAAPVSITKDTAVVDVDATELRASTNGWT